MKHGMKMRKLSRTSSHRQALLRNLVSALLHHEQIKTTLPKAKEAARVVERMITLGKRGTDGARRSAQAYLVPAHTIGEKGEDMRLSQKMGIRPASYVIASRMAESTLLPVGSISGSSLSDPSSSSMSENAATSDDQLDFTSDDLLLPSSYNPPNPSSLFPKLFTTLSERYASRQGGYTRILRFGKRPGDNAQVCLLSLVDGPRDLRAEISARALGREVAEAQAEAGAEVGEVRATIREFLHTKDARKTAAINPWTKKSVQKVVKFRSAEEVEAFAEKAANYAVSGLLFVFVIVPVPSLFAFRASWISRPLDSLFDSPTSPRPCFKPK